MKESRSLQAENSLRAGEQPEELSPLQKSWWRARLVTMTILPLIVALALPLLIAVRFPPHNPLWSQPNGRVILLILLLNGAVFFTIPAIALFRLLRRKRRTGSYYPTLEDLEKHRARQRKPKPLWQKTLSAVFELAAAITFTIDATHRSHRGAWEQVLASIFWLSAAMSVWGLIGSQSGLAKLRQREGFACPECGAAPPIGDKWKCKQCGKGFDTFLARAVCPHCGTQHPATMCAACEKMHPMNDWIYAYTARNCGPTAG